MPSRFTRPVPCTMIETRSSGSRTIRSTTASVPTPKRSDAAGSSTSGSRCANTAMTRSPAITSLSAARFFLRPTLSGRIANGNSTVWRTGSTGTSRGPLPTASSAASASAGTRVFGSRSAVARARGARAAAESRRCAGASAAPSWVRGSWARPPGAAAGHDADPWIGTSFGPAGASAWIRISSMPSR